MPEVKGVKRFLNFLKIFCPHRNALIVIIVQNQNLDDMKEYLMLIREDVEAYKNMSSEEMQADIEKHVQWVGQLVEKGHFKGGNPLSPEGKTLKGQKQLVTDGPFIELKEGVSGYYFLLANSLEEAAEIARGCPSLQIGATLEVREIIQTGN